MDQTVEGQLTGAEFGQDDLQSGNDLEMVRILLIVSGVLFDEIVLVALDIAPLTSHHLSKDLPNLFPIGAVDMFACGVTRASNCCPSWRPWRTDRRG